jgi:hypothetical protein
MESVTVEAIRPLVINHFMLYPGERRELPAAQAAQLLAARPGFLRLLGAAPEVAPEVAPEPAPVTPEPMPAAKPRRKGKPA